MSLPRARVAAVGKTEVAPNVDRAVEILRTVAPFSSLPAAVLGEVLARSRSRPFVRGELVVRPGDSADCVILVATGLVLLGAGPLGVSARLARRLLALADTYGQPAVGPSGRGQVIDLDLRHQDLADLVGASRETVSKAMGRLGSAALLRSHRGRIVLLDEAALRRVARM